MKTPCIKVCKVSDGKCLGCGRTLEQIRLWSRYSEGERESIMKGLEVEKVQSQLNSYRHFNNGYGLVVSKDFAKELRSMGVTGPYFEVKQIKGE